MKKHLSWVLVMMGVASVGCGEMEANDSTATSAETAKTPLTVETAARESSAASRDVSTPTADTPEPSVAAAGSHTCGACMLDGGLDGRGHFKGARSCCWNVPVVDENGKISHICIPYHQDCGPSWSSLPSASSS